MNEKPFSLTPDPRYFYLSDSHREALAALVYGVRERAGLITLTGPVGVGKTMILASFLDQIREHAETVSFSGAISADRLEFLKDLCSVLGTSRSGRQRKAGVWWFSWMRRRTWAWNSWSISTT